VSYLIDFQTLLYGAILGLGILAGLKLIDMILEIFYKKTVFGKIWFWASKGLKKLMTRVKHIRISFDFSARIENTEIEKVKGTLDFFANSIVKKQQIHLSPIAWTDSDIGSTRICYNQREFRLEMAMNSSSADLNDEGENDECVTRTTVFVEGVSFRLEADFSFHELESMLLSLGALVNSIKEEFKEALMVIQFSKGMFTIEPLRRQISIDEWIRKKKFEVSLVLKGQDEVIINLLPKKAELVFPSMQIDDKVLEYLKEAILNYYL
jgi:hypothetical protein